VPEDDDLLCAIQSPQPTRRAELHPHFGGYLYQVASRCCERCGLSHDDAREVVSMVETKVLDLDPKTKPQAFDPSSCSAKQYLVGLTRNATKQLHKFRMQVPARQNRHNPDFFDSNSRSQPGDEYRRHDWFDPDNANQGLPSCPEEIVDSVAGWDRADEQNRELVDVALTGEPEQVLLMVKGYYIEELPAAEVAKRVGVASHTTVLRQLEKFRVRARSRVEAYLASGI
jgi:DNA-directed RNA polymerase specialized sigma24 family protein